MTSSMANPEMMRRLKPHQEEILELTYERIVRVCRDHGITPIHIIVPDPRDGSMAGEQLAWAERLARKTHSAQSPGRQAHSPGEGVGFETLDLEGVFDHEARTELWVSPQQSSPPTAAAIG